MWNIIKFKSASARDRWIAKHGESYQYVEVYINNGYALEVRKLRIIG